MAFAVKPKLEKEDKWWAIASARTVILRNNILMKYLSVLI